MKHRLFTILSALSLLMFVAVIVLWVRSYVVAEAIYHRGPPAPSETLNYLSLSRGEFVLRLIRSSQGIVSWAQPSTPTLDRLTVSPATSEDAQQVARHPAMVRFAGVTLGRADWQRGGRELFGIVPAWLLASVLGLPPALWLVHMVLNRRLRAGLCPSCGYDLRATPGRCPECGLVPAAPPPP